MRVLSMVALVFGMLVGQALALNPRSNLPLDERIRSGELDNGLSYFIRENEKPAFRAELRLVVKAGSTDEDDDQQGLAHFVEHMLFNGTEKYAGNEIVDFLESIGARFGADLNAYTSFDETVYMLEIPTDREGLLEQGVEVLAEFAHRATFSEEEIDRERGVVLDEWRRGRGASARVRDQQLPVLLQGSRYAERLPIGKPDIIENAPPEALTRFYRDWYRPERMAVVCTGAVNVDEVERLIRTYFAPMESSQDLREGVEWPVPGHADTLFALADDPELTGTNVGWSVKRSIDTDPKSYETYHRDLVRRMTVQMFNMRLAELTQSDQPPFLGARMGVSGFGSKNEYTRFVAGVEDGDEARGMEALVTEVERARRFGFLPQELDRVRANLLSRIETLHAERDNQESSSLAAELIRHFLEDEPVPGIEAEYRIWNDFLPTVTTDDCHAAFTALAQGHGVVVESARPSASTLVSEQELHASLRSSKNASLDPWAEAAVERSLIAWRGQPGQIVSREFFPSVDVTEFVLSNGIRVLVKPTDFQADEIQFQGVALGGLSVAADDDLLSARSALGIVAESGWGGHDAPTLRKLMAGKVASARPFFGGREHGVRGGASIKDLDTALDLAVLVMTEPNENEESFQRYLVRLRSDLENRDSDPGTKFRDRLRQINTQDDPRNRPMTVARVPEIDLETALDFYRDRFANPADFTFFFVGNVAPEVLAPKLERTLGSISVRSRKHSDFVVRPDRFPKGQIQEVVRAGSEPKGQTSMTFWSYQGSDPREWHRLRTGASILGRRLREELREELGATYGVSVAYSHSIIGPARGKFIVGFGSDPTDTETLTHVVLRSIEELKEKGPTTDEISKEQQIQTRDLETAWERNGFWLGSLSALRQRERPLDEVLNRQVRIDELSAERIHDSLQKHLSVDRRTIVHWAPKIDPDTP